jgi:hypothetical protein
MKLVLDMVHHNPGEAGFESAFLDPAHLAAYGYNGQVFKHINCAALFDKLGGEVFPSGSRERAWANDLAGRIERQIRAAKAAGLAVFHHIDLFVLPTRLVDLYREDICDPETGLISLNRPRTMEIQRALFDEVCERFPEVDGYIVRVGETYLFDTPYHTGNSPIPAAGEPWRPTYLYQDALDGGRSRNGCWTPAQAAAYVTLLRFLREELCVRHGKRLIFRTWDIFPDKLHAVRDHYLRVTDQVEPHPLLSFSLKHTALDFWRRVKVNECLTHGRHPQIVEVQCAREYEGKGAYPNYVMDGVANGFEENSHPVGLKNLLRHPVIQGVYGWSRGGGWYGPYVKNEFWSDLHAYVLGRVAACSWLSEESAFREYCLDRMGLSEENAWRFRALCLLSAKAVLKGRYCEAFDRALDESLPPTALWMRDDRLGGADQLALVFDYLIEHKLLDQALEEKAEAVRLWERICELGAMIEAADARLREQLAVSVNYGRLLYGIVHEGWKVMAAVALWDRTQEPDLEEASRAIQRYDALWREYRGLTSSPECASLHRGIYFSLPGSPPVAGLDESVSRCRARLMSGPAAALRFA